MQSRLETIKSTLLAPDSAIKPTESKKMSSRSILLASNSSIKFTKHSNNSLKNITFEDPCIRKLDFNLTITSISQHNYDKTGSV